MRAFIEKIQRLMVAATFAEAGDHETAMEVLQEREEPVGCTLAGRQQTRIPMPTTLPAHSMRD